MRGASFLFPSTINEAFGYQEIQLPFFWIQISLQVSAMVYDERIDQ